MIVITSYSIHYTKLYDPYESNRFVRFFDVGQGDAIQIHDNGCDLLIDTGNSDGYDTLIEYFHSVNLHHLDYLIITHLHADHYGRITSYNVCYTKLLRMEMINRYKGKRNVYIVGCSNVGKSKSYNFV